MRQIILDTETTGLEVGKGHRIIEIGCIELVERRLTDRKFHCYLNPERLIDPGAAAVHGISDEFLVDKPRFAEIADALLGFIADSELIIHNAPFDVAFLDNELLQAGGRGRIAEHARVLDTLKLAREKYPGQKNSLDALCKRLNVDNSHRQLHGALLDAQLLAEVYLAMTAGQGELGLASSTQDEPRNPRAMTQVGEAGLRVLRATAEELAEHEMRLKAIAASSKGRCVWLLSS